MYWQTVYVFISLHRCRVGMAFVAVLVLASLTSCSSKSSSMCGDGNSISGFVSGFSQGLDNFSEE